jgi:ribonuclease HI
MTTDALTAACWTGWCDGSAVPNPGKMAVGGVLQGPDLAEHRFSFALGRSGCNNEAEAAALLALLQLAARLAVRRLVVWSDSDVVVRVAPDAASQEAQRLAPLFAEIRLAMRAFEALELRWLPQHRNLIADALSRQALGLVPRPAAARPKRRRR